ncbi:MAG TPA: hypothetical protein VHF06_09070 [Pseudonocardiaceae bacterium]|nr:hypothetical protein [Pseudonocardiaceae bacterium]
MSTAAWLVPSVVAAVLVVLVVVGRFRDARRTLDAILAEHRELMEQRDDGAPGEDRRQRAA